MNWYKKADEEYSDTNKTALLYLERAITSLKGEQLEPLGQPIDIDAIQKAFEAVENQGRK